MKFYNFYTLALSLLILNTLQSQTTSALFHTTVQKEVTYGYLLHKPKNTNTPKPLLIFLHGSGEKGNDLEKVKVHGPFQYLKANDLDAFVLAPQCPIDAYWDSEALYQLIQKIISQNSIDTQRIYLTGLSMGAWGAWNLAISYPDTFAALVPIAGFVDRIPMIENCKLKSIPIRIFHGLLDDVVDLSYSTTIYKKLKPCCIDIQLTVFDDANHDSWTRVYNNAAIYQWMFQQVKK